MAGGYDGEIRIKTKIENADMSSQLMQLENRMEKTARKAQQLEDAMREMASKKIPTDEYKKLTDQIEEAKKKVEEANEELNQMRELGFKDENLQPYIKSLDDATREVNKLAEAKAKLEATNAAYNDPTNTAEYQKLSDQLSDANREMAMLSKRHDEIIAKQSGIGSGAKQIEKVGKAAKKSAGLMSTLLSRLKGIALSLLIFNWITKAFNGMVGSFKIGIQNMAKYSGSFNERMSSLKSSIATLNAALGTLAAPIVSMVTPALARLCDWLTKAINAMNQFIALLSGQSTWTRAKQQQVDYAKSLEKTSGVAKKAAGALAAFDDLNVLQKNDSGSGGSGSTAGMYEEVQVSDKMASKLGKVKDLAKQIKEEFSVGWKKAFEKLGIDGQVQNIRSNLASIKDSFIDIFSAESVKNAAGNFAVTFVTSLGTIAASFVSIGVTIAQNLTGGIKKYLDDNKDDIKKHLTQMFDIGADILLLAASAAAAFALIFSAFGSDSGQQLTANLIQMFSDAFLSVSAIAAQFADDILHLLLNPFVNNQDDIATAVQGIIDVLAVFSGTVSDIVEQVGDRFTALYINHISPFVSHFTAGISDLLGSFLNFWNNNMQPVLMQWASMFDDTYQSHLKPMINAFMNLLNTLIEYIQPFWEYLKEPLQWIIDNLLSLLQPILEDLGKQVKFAVDIIIDAITIMLKVIKDVFAILGDLINGDWRKLWKDAKQIFKDVVISLLSLAASLANGFIDCINAVIRAFNELHFEFPDWVPVVGGKSFGPHNYPEVPRAPIPQLANGGITTGATLAEIGEAGREAVLPLDRNTDWMDALADKIADRMPATGGSVDASLILDGETCGRLFLPYLQSEEVRLGIAEG